jgi:hypothetical protein
MGAAKGCFTIPAIRDLLDDAQALIKGDDATCVRALMVEPHICGVI